MTKICCIEPPIEVKCPNCQTHLSERLVTNEGKWCILRYFCGKCDYQSLKHIEHVEPDPSRVIRGLVGESNYAG